MCVNAYMYMYEWTCMQHHLRSLYIPPTCDSMSSLGVPLGECWWVINECVVPFPSDFLEICLYNHCDVKRVVFIVCVCVRVVFYYRQRRKKGMDRLFLWVTYDTRLQIHLGTPDHMLTHSHTPKFTPHPPPHTHINSLSHINTHRRSLMRFLGGVTEGPGLTNQPRGEGKNTSRSWPRRWTRRPE